MYLMMDSSENPKRQANKLLVPVIASSSSELLPGTRLFASIRYLSLHGESKVNGWLASVSLLGEWVSRRIGFTTVSGTYPSMVFASLANLQAIMQAFEATDVYLCPSALTE
nr:unnamed protein product [Spirometra erinaceieuropaei]